MQDVFAGATAHNLPSDDDAALRYYEDLRVAEIAVLLHTSPGAVSTPLSRVLSTLTTWMENADVR